MNNNRFIAMRMSINQDTHKPLKCKKCFVELNTSNSLYSETENYCKKCYITNNINRNNKILFNHKNKLYLN